MIRENITVNIGGSYDLDGEIIVPSDVLTSTPQEDKGDLTTNLNFVLKLVDEEKKIPVNTYADVEFTLGDKTYTASMKAYNRAGNIIALQYAGELTSEDAPEPVEHTLVFSPTGPFYTYYDKYSNETTPSENVWLLYDNSYVTSPMLYLDHNMGIGGSYTFGSPTGNRINWFVNGAAKSYETGEYTDTFTTTYLGLTTSCNVTAVIVDTTPQDLPLEPFMMTGNPTEWIGEPISDFVEVRDPNVLDEYDEPILVTENCVISCDDENISISNTEVTASSPGQYVIVATDNTTGRTGSVTWVIEILDENVN